MSEKSVNYKYSKQEVKKGSRTVNNSNKSNQIDDDNLNKKKKKGCCGCFG